MRYSIIIPTYNHFYDCLKPCLDSIIKNTDLKDVEIIVVANGCTDETKSYVESLGLKLIWIDEPAGYTKATNEGIKASSGDYIILLNNDNVILDSEKNLWLKILSDPFAKDASVGMTGAAKDFHVGTKCDFLLFFCVMISRKIIQEIGLLDESFNPGYGEDIDYCHKVRLAGYRILQVPNDVTFKNEREITDHEIQFPIWHKSSITVHGVKGWDSIVDRNEKILHERYSQKLKLNLGCGSILLPGYVNIDLYNPLAQKQMDVRHLDYPDNSVDEIAAFHLFEHFSCFQANDILKEWNRVLVPGGKLILELPDILELCRNFEKSNKNERYTLLNCIYGTTVYDPNVSNPHLFGWYEEILKDHLISNNFTKVSKLDPVFKWHWGYNMRIEAYKPVNHNISQKVKYSIVIPTYNHLHDCLVPCLESIKKYTDLSNIEVIVVANGCTDGTEEYVNKLGHPFKVIVMPDAAGYIKPTNAGIKESSGEYIILLNNDAWVSKDTWLSLLEEPFKGDSKVGITGVKKSWLDEAQGEYILFFCVMIKREVFDNIGILDENFGEGYYEDVDFSIRARNAGYNIVQVPHNVEYNTEFTKIDEKFDIFPIRHCGGATFSRIYGDTTEREKQNLPLLKNERTKSSLDYLKAKHNFKSTIERKYTEYKDTPSDINEHLPILKLYAQQCEHITEFGVREVVSTWGLLAGMPKTMVSYDLRSCPKIEFAIDAAKREQIKLSFIQGDTSKINIENTDLLFIDTYHSYSHLLTELNLHASKVSKYIIMHDTKTFDHKSVSGDGLSLSFDESVNKGLKDAIEEFLINNTQWKIKEIYENNNGLTILENVNLVNKDSLDYRYKQACQDTSSDINEHLPILKRYAEICDHVTEFGVRHGQSTLAFLSAKPKRLISYDWHKEDEVDKLIDLAREENIDFRFIQKDVLEADIEPTDLLFIDTIHCYDQLKSELKLHTGKVKKYIILHDTVFHAEEGMQGDYYGGWPGGPGTGLKRAIDEFLDSNKNWRIKEHLTNNNGMTVLERINDKELPDGWFSDLDIDLYREYVSKVPDGGIIIEIGNWKGRSLCSLADIIKAKKLKVYAVDTFKGGTTHAEEAKKSDIYQEFINNIDRFGLNEYLTIFRTESVSAASMLANNCADLIFIDASHDYESVKNDISAWLPKLKSNGIIGGHDYPYCADVKKAVDEIFGEEVKSYSSSWYVEKGVRRSKIYDCFMFFNELDILELRFNELYNTVDYFVIVESRFTHSGLPKPLYFAENLSRFEQFLPKVRHVVIDEFPPGDSYSNETFQRNAIKRGLVDCHDDDIIIMTDADEIPKASVIDKYRPSMGLTCLHLRLFCYKLNYEVLDGWYKARIFPYSEAKNCDIDSFRTTRDYDFKHTIQNAGWHFSFIGDKEFIKQKITSYVHTELNIPQFNNDDNIIHSLENATDLYHRGIQYTIVDIDDSYPLYLLCNMEYYDKKGYIYHKSQPQIVPQQKTQRKVYDCFTFFNELDLLEIRLNELDPYVDKFVICEMATTHTGIHKPLYFKNNKDRFKNFESKIIHLIAPLVYDPDPWVIEHYQRNYIMNALQNCSDEDIIILSDIDEIPRGEKIKEYNPQQDWMYFEQTLYNFYLNLKAGKDEIKPGVFSRITTYGNMKRFGLNTTDLRYRECTESQKISNGGWHFSWMGGGDVILEKLKSWAHQEVKFPDLDNKDNINKNIEQGIDIFNRSGYQFEFVDIDSTYPNFVSENQSNLITKGLLFQKSTKEDNLFTNQTSLTPAFIDDCVYRAEQGISNINPDVLTIEGMSSTTNRHLLNNLGSCSGLNYLEVGCWRGSTCCSVLSNNKMGICYIVDDFSLFSDFTQRQNKQFIHAKDELIHNVNTFGGDNDCTLIENDFFKIDIQNLPPINMYLFDGNHTYEDQYKALKFALPAMAKRFLFIVDDYEWPSVKKGTQDSLKDLIKDNQISIIHEVYLPVPLLNSEWEDGKTAYGKWHNGLFLALIEKK